MGKNYDKIATVDIDIASPLVDDTSFDNLLIIGPLPKVAPQKAPPKVGVYASMEEVISAGWSISSDADPVGLAAQAAYSQSPSPTAVYIAPQQYTETAIASQKLVAAVNEIIKTFTKEDASTDYIASYDEESRTLLVDLVQTVDEISSHPTVDPFGAIVTAGYTVKVNGQSASSLDAFKRLEIYTSDITGLSEKNAESKVEVTLKITGEAEESVEYGAVIRYPVVPGVEEAKNFAMDLGHPELGREPATDTIARALGTTGWYVLCTAGVDEKEYEQVAALVETQEKMFAYTELNILNSDEAEPTVSPIYYRTLGVYGKVASDQEIADIPAANPYMNVAFVAKWLNYSSGSETSAFKALAGVTPSELTSTEMKTLEEANLNYFITVGSKNITMIGKVLAGEWADVIRFRDWLKNDMQVRVVNLFIARPKIPYTDPGIALVQNQMIAALKAGQDAGGIAPDEFDEDGNKIPGFTTKVPLAASLSASEKASRKLTKCSFKARLAGAIHFAEIKGSLTYEL